MSHLRGAAIVALGVMFFGPVSAMAAEAIGEAVRIRTEVRGANGLLAVKDPVYRDERILTSKSGLGQFVFRDGTKLAVGWGSSVVIDKFVFDDSNNLQKLSLRATKGTFRWVSGKSKSTAYEILTPAGTIGVRGTAFDFYVGGDGTTALVLLNGEASFCGPGGCKQLTKRCDCVIANRNGNITDTRRVNRRILETLGNEGALPFLSGNQQLSGGLGWVGGGCSLRAALPIPGTQQERFTPQPEKKQAQPQKPRKPDKPPPKPDKPEKPPRPEKPEKPPRPEKPEKPPLPEKPETRRETEKPRQEQDRPREGSRNNG
ncbi:FecR domain-containing protein [Sinorhizobium garamanticum]|uniref:FecR domain-containing protein n=1 Tax=Sinorhizobium garamanticum TaxID=680247 RepID=A0ABY8D794_9HYPH|nr:FecR domain-containing protein [Sinorhizobium garamanticum]WEX86750.1 FecR domain-containing protein [Sinorhizobium garamanticum]